MIWRVLSSEERVEEREEGGKERAWRRSCLLGRLLGLRMLMGWGRLGGRVRVRVRVRRDGDGRRYCIISVGILLLILGTFLIILRVMIIDGLYYTLFVTLWGPPAGAGRASGCDTTRFSR